MSEKTFQKKQRLLEVRKKEKEQVVLDSIMTNPTVTIREICKKTGWPTQTVTGYLTNIYKKLGIPSTVGKDQKREWLLKEYSDTYNDPQTEISEPVQIPPIPSVTPVNPLSYPEIFVKPPDPKVVYPESPIPSLTPKIKEVLKPPKITFIKNEFIEPQEETDVRLDYRENKWMELLGKINTVSYPHLDQLETEWKEELKEELEEINLDKLEKEWKEELGETDLDQLVRDWWEELDKNSQDEVDDLNIEEVEDISTEETEIFKRPREPKIVYPETSQESTIPSKSNIPVEKPIINRRPPRRQPEPTGFLGIPDMVWTIIGLTMLCMFLALILYKSLP